MAPTRKRKAAYEVPTDEAGFAQLLVAVVRLELAALRCIAELGGVRNRCVSRGRAVKQSRLCATHTPARAVRAVAGAFAETPGKGIHV